VPGSLPHLIGRFFDFARAEPLGEKKSAEIRQWLGIEAATAFFEQDPRDQTHGYQAAADIRDHGDVSGEHILAALLHDVGKRHARLGLWGRTLASVLIRLHLPLTRRMRLYRDHGPIGADELAQIGMSDLVVDFARHHHGTRPTSIDRALWDRLQAADRPAKPLVPGQQG